METKPVFLIAGDEAMHQDWQMKMFFALIVAGLSAWVLFTPFDLPPIPFFFIDEAIALLLFTKSMSCLGFDVSRILPFFPRSGRSKPSPATPGSMNASNNDTVIDV